MNEYDWRRLLNYLGDVERHIQGVKDVAQNKGHSLIILLLLLIVFDTCRIRQDVRNIKAKLEASHDPRME